MIKPDTLWNLFKHASEKTIGRVCLSLANRQDELETPLNEYEIVFFNMIRESEEWMDEAVSAVKQRKHEWYETQKKKKNQQSKSSNLTDLTDLTDLTSNASTESIDGFDRFDHPPSVRPSIQINNSGGGDTRTRTRIKHNIMYPKTWDEVEAYLDEQEYIIADYDGIRAKFMYLTEHGWKDVTGKQIKNWKLFFGRIADKQVIAEAERYDNGEIRKAQ